MKEAEEKKEVSPAKIQFNEIQTIEEDSASSGGDTSKDHNSSQSSINKSSQSGSQSSHSSFNS